MIDRHPVGPVRRSPACTCCRRGRVRVHVLMNDDHLAWACPTCDRVEPHVEGERNDRPLTSAPQVPRTTP